MAKIVVTVEREGGHYSPDKRLAAPIRILSDRYVVDDIYSACVARRGERHPKYRERLTRKEFRRVRKAAQQNRRVGVV